MDVGIQAEVAHVGVVGSSIVDLLLVSDHNTYPRTRLAPAAWVPTVIVCANGPRGPSLITNFPLNAAAPRLVRGVVVRRAA